MGRSIFDHINKKRGRGRVKAKAPEVEGTRVVLDVEGEANYLAGETIRGRTVAGSLVRFTCVVITDIEIFESAGSGGETGGMYSEFDNTGQVGHERQTVIDVDTVADERTGAFSVVIPVSAPPSMRAYEKRTVVQVAGSNREIRASIVYSVGVDGSAQRVIVRVLGPPLLQQGASSEETHCEVAVKALACIPAGSLDLKGRCSSSVVRGTDAPTLTYTIRNDTSRRLDVSIRLKQKLFIRARRQKFETETVLCQLAQPALGPNSTETRAVECELPGKKSMALLSSIETPTWQVTHAFELVVKTKIMFFFTKTATLKFAPLTVNALLDEFPKPSAVANPRQNGVVLDPMPEAIPISP